MRRSAARFLTPVLVVLLVAGCGGGNAEKETAAEETDGNGLPAITGGYGTKPKIKFDPAEEPPAKTKSAVLVEGKGPKVAKGDLLVADYLGQIYGSKKVFDNSYDRGQPAGFQIGVGKVIPGWDKALVGVKAGSRVVMVVPPAEGYGKEGNAGAGIKGTDALVFVVDVIASHGKGGVDAAGEPVTDLPPGLPKVAGEPGEAPTVTVPKRAAPPKKADATVVVKGTGPGLERGKLTVMHFVAVNWSGQPVSSSWDSGAPQAVPLGAQDQPTPFDVLLGIPIGSRALVVLPPQQGGKAATDSIAVVVDIIAQHGPAKEKA